MPAVPVRAVAVRAVAVVTVTVEVTDTLTAIAIAIAAAAVPAVTAVRDDSRTPHRTCPRVAVRPRPGNDEDPRP
ncbi:hypothetical protein ACQEVM_31805 [Streptomyces sp. CA-243310]|uniref:hypothetical protein n=1 Tax=Streptomyces sp. CA-243310 TaxID=3240056 RepID=UPI003D8F9496